MATYVYVGWGPEVDPEGGIARPGDEREFGEQPTWGRWSKVDEPEDAPAESPAPPPEPALAPFTAPPVTPEGM